MKALVALLSVAVVSSTHDIEKRSLLRVAQDHEHHEYHHELERTGRDSPVSAPAGYLPPAEDGYVDYDEDSAGFGTGKGYPTNNDVRRFGLQGQDNGNQQSQYRQNERSPQRGAIGNSISRQSSNRRNQPEGNQSVKFGQRINANFQNTGLTRQQGPRRNQQGRGRNQQKAHRKNQFDLENDQDGSLRTYGNEVDQEQNLNSQQQGGPRSHTRRENNQRSQGKNSQFGNLEDSSDQSQYGQHTGKDNGGQGGQFGQQGHQNQNHQAGGQRNRQQGQEISLQRENIRLLQGQAKALIGSYGGQEQIGSRLNQFGQVKSQTQSIQFGQGGNSQQQRQGQDNNLLDQQEQDQSADDSYGAPGQGKGNNKSQISQDQRGQNQGRQVQQGETQTGQNQRRKNQKGQNQRGQNQGGFRKGNGLVNKQIQAKSADDSYGAPGQGQGNENSQIGQRGENLRGQIQRGQNQGNGFVKQQVQDQSADESYGAPGQGSENNKFQNSQGQKGQNQRRQNQGVQNQRRKNHVGQTNKRQNQNIQNQRAFPSQIGSSGSITSTINRFLPASLNNPSVNIGHRAPQLSGQTGQHCQGCKSGQNSQRSHTGSGRNSNPASRFAGQRVQQGTGSNGFPFSAPGSDDFDLEDTLICPGGTVETCIKVCPGNTAELYGGCVQGCADRCDAQGEAAQQQGTHEQGSQFGQQGKPGQNAQLGQDGHQSISDQFNQHGQSVQFGNGQSVPFESQGQGAEDQQGQYGQQT